MELADFINDRLDEDEAAARACADSSGNLLWRDHLVQASGDRTIRTDPGARPVARIRLVDSQAYDGRTLDPDACAAHIARHDPARALREVAAKRAILAEHAEDGHWCRRPADTGWVVYEAGERVVKTFPCGTVRDLAAVWSDHPDYPEWLSR
jgi:hypothetical protein